LNCAKYPFCAIQLKEGAYMELFNDAPQIIQEFLNYQLVIQNKSKNTVHEYYYDLRTFFRYLKNKKNPQKDLLFEEIKIDF
jgi:site-specific recombinase XerD